MEETYSVQVQGENIESDEGVKIRYGDVDVVELEDKLTLPILSSNEQQT